MILATGDCKDLDDFTVHHSTWPKGIPDVWAILSSFQRPYFFRNEKEKKNKLELL
jgi:hypothetical protein